MGPDYVPISNTDERTERAVHYTELSHSGLAMPLPHARGILESPQSSSSVTALALSSPDSVPIGAHHPDVSTTHLSWYKPFVAMKGVSRSRLTLFATVCKLCFEVHCLTEGGGNRNFQIFSYQRRSFHQNCMSGSRDISLTSFGPRSC